MDPLKVGKPAGRKIKPTPVHRHRKFSWEQVCSMRQLWNNGQPGGMSVREISERFNISQSYLRYVLHGEARISEDPDRGNPPCFVNQVADLPVEFLRSANGELFRRRDSGKSTIRPSIPAQTVALIRHGYRHGMNTSQLSVLYGVSRRYVRRIVKNEVRKNI